MEEIMLEIRDFQGEGYEALIDYGEWRVAMLRYLEALQPDRIDSMERHTQTDEVFVLLKGQGVLILGGYGAQVEGIYSQPMEPGKLYNVKCNTWHTLLLSREATMLIIENKDTGAHNSEYTQLSAEQRGSILKKAQDVKIE
jgi:mannose-6-phosphate isomerase-like protein (cupin superfamily)